MFFSNSAYQHIDLSSASLTSPKTSCQFFFREKFPPLYWANRAQLSLHLAECIRGASAKIWDAKGSLTEVHFMRKDHFIAIILRLMLKYRPSWYGQTGVAGDRRPNSSIYMLPNLVVWHTENACMVVLSVCRAWNTLGCLMECLNVMLEFCQLAGSTTNLWWTFYSITMCRVGGGILHIHGNVNDSDETRWLDNVVESISNIAKNHGKNGAFMLWSVAMHFCSPRVQIPFLCPFCVAGLSWNVSVEHVERVKWYGPHIRHLVVDVRCRQI